MCPAETGRNTPATAHATERLPTENDMPIADGISAHLESSTLAAGPRALIEAALAATIPPNTATPTTIPNEVFLTSLAVEGFRAGD